MNINQEKQIRFPHMKKKLQITQEKTEALQQVEEALALEQVHLEHQGHLQVRHQVLAQECFFKKRLHKGIF